MFLECPQPVTPALHYFNMWQDAVQDPHANDFDWQALQTAATQQSQARAELVRRMRDAAQQEAYKNDVDWQALQTAATQQSQARAELVCRMREAAQQEAEKDELDKMLCIPK